MRSQLLLTVLLLILPFCSVADTITGAITDYQTRRPVAFVNVVNIYTSAGAVSDQEGRFTIEAEHGQLLEFRKIGYKTVRIRIPEGTIPRFFGVMMQQGPVELPQFELEARSPDWKKDSIRYHQLYKEALSFEKLEGLDVIRHPFSALSKRNRQIWAFQKEYNYWEQQKYIDYTFNEKLVASLTGLGGDSLQRYMKQFRPSYEHLRSLTEYGFYSYVKESAAVYRKGRQYRPAIRRSAN